MRCKDAGVGAIGFCVCGCRFVDGEMGVWVGLAAVEYVQQHVWWHACIAMCRCYSN